MRGRGQNRDYGRGRPGKPPRRTVYIICEGSTEYFYLMAIRMTRRLRTVKIDIDPGCRSGCDPKSLLKYATGIRTEAEYDDVWCVFDHDGRAYVDEVLDEASRENVPVAFSNPCFELWYFLHYEYSTGPCTQDQMLDRLKRHIPGYTKARNVFAQLPDMAIALKRASDLRRHHAASGSRATENPSTNADSLVQLLYSLEDPR